MIVLKNLQTFIAQHISLKRLVIFFKVEKHQKILTLPSATINVF